MSSRSQSPRLASCQPLYQMLNLDLFNSSDVRVQVMVDTLNALHGEGIGVVRKVDTDSPPDGPAS